MLSQKQYAKQPTENLAKLKTTTTHDKGVHYEDVEFLVHIAKDLVVFYEALDRQEHVYLEAAIKFERLFCVMHKALFGDVLSNKNLLEEVNRWASTEVNQELPSVSLKMMP